jgi:putative protein-disulfide isomerase
MRFPIHGATDDRGGPVVAANAAAGAVSEVTRPTVVYGNDPLCGWCFGIGPDLLEAQATLGSEVDWRLETGGLVSGQRVRPIAHDRAYLRQGLDAVEAVTGRRAGEAYWRDIVEPGTYVSDSEPAVRAVVAARELSPGNELAFSHALTDALYLDGRVPDDPGTLRQVAGSLGMDGAELVIRWRSERARAATADAFVRASRLGITTYPSLFLEVPGGGLQPIVSGYADAASIVARTRALSRTDPEESEGAGPERAR